MIYDEIECTYILYPNVVRTVDGIAYDADDNEVEIDKDAVKAKVEEYATKQADARQSALNKLMALGLTEEEALALGVK